MGETIPLGYKAVRFLSVDGTEGTLSIAAGNRLNAVTVFSLLINFDAVWQSWYRLAGDCMAVERAAGAGC